MQRVAFVNGRQSRKIGFGRVYSIMRNAPPSTGHLAHAYGVVAIRWNSLRSWGYYSGSQSHKVSRITQLEARDHFREMLRLNPNDNQGIRELLLALLI